jgi:hypothetical protein
MRRRIAPYAVRDVNLSMYPIDWAIAGPELADAGERLQHLVG